MPETPTSDRSKQFMRWTIVGAALVACLAYIGLTFNWSAIGSVIRSANLVEFLVGGCATILAYFVVRTLRWSVVLRSSGVRPSFRALYRWSVLSQAAIVVTPFQSGELVKIEMLRNAGHAERSHGYGGFAVERVADIAVLVAIAAVFVATTIETFGSAARPIAVVAIVGVVALLGVVVVALLVRKQSNFLGEMAVSALDVVRQPSVFAPVVLLTVCSWSIVALGWMFTLHSIGIGVSFGQALGLVAIVTLVNVASLIPGAVGISEVGITESLVRLGYDVTLAQAGAVLIRAFALEVLVLAALHVLVWRILPKLTDTGRAVE